MGSWSSSGAARRAGVALGLALLGGCAGTSKTTFDDSPAGGAQGGDAGIGGGSATGGTTGGGDGATGGASTGGAAGSVAANGGGSTGGASGETSATGGTAGGNAGGTKSAGAGGTNGAGASSTPNGGASAAGAAGIDLSGMWAMFVWEDPVVVLLEQNGGTLTGRGCCAWSENTSSSCCGSLTGSVTEGHATFSFVPGEPTPLTLAYGADVYVSTDGERLGGGFGVGNTTGGKMAWRRPNEGTRLRVANPALVEAVTIRQGAFDLTLVSERADGLFEHARGYTVVLAARGNEPGIYGDLGPFWGGEMNFDAANDRITAGPVPETDPSFPTTLELDFDDGVLASVTAYYPGDAPYVFMPTPLPI